MRWLRNGWPLATWWPTSRSGSRPDRPQPLRGQCP
ncbi:MAG TPA: hypothetical protein DGK99_00110 [Acidimicrobiaceae bacterium]|nr:hypothetical protein [Actinomycetes bacterium]HCV99788.1 hypothetical protein [Acidimicrobiaceae bacterium]